MSGYINRFVHYLSGLFVKEKEKPRVRKDRPGQTLSKYFTPRRAPLNMKNGDLHYQKRVYSDPEFLANPIANQRPTFPLGRSSSQISLMKFGSEESLPFRRPESTNRSRNGMNRPLDFKFGPATVDMNTNHKLQPRDFPCLPAHKGSKSSLEFSLTGEELCGTSAKSSNCFVNEKVLPYSRRHLHLKSNPFSHPGFPVRSSQGNSKIPVRSEGRFIAQPKFLQRHTLPANHLNSRNYDLSKEEDTADNVYRSPPDVSNWAAYRMDTSDKFERIFKTLSRHKHTARCNLIDSNTHSHWMLAAGITVDRDSKMFKQFAGGKIVLTFGEYKFLIDKICAVHELDYWDVLRKMATFQEEEINHEALLTAP